MKQVKDDEEDLNAHNLKRSVPCGVVMKKMKNVESVASVFMVCSAMRCAQQCGACRVEREKRVERRRVIDRECVKRGELGRYGAAVVRVLLWLMSCGAIRMCI